MRAAFLFGLMAVPVLTPSEPNARSAGWQYRPAASPPGQASPSGKAGEQRPARVISGDLFAFIQTAMKEKRLVELDVRGFSLTKVRYYDYPDDGGLLIGFQFGFGKFVNNLTINALRPIYLTQNGEKLGAWHGKEPASPVTVKAKPGYVVGGIAIRSGLAIDGLSLTFMKLEQDRLTFLNPDDAYDSDWIGGQGGNPATIAGQGCFLVGVCGHLNNDRNPCSLGMITVLTAKK